MMSTFTSYLATIISLATSLANLPVNIPSGDSYPTIDAPPSPNPAPVDVPKISSANATATNPSLGPTPAPNIPSANDILLATDTTRYNDQDAAAIATATNDPRFPSPNPITVSDAADKASTHPGEIFPASAFVLPKYRPVAPSKLADIRRQRRKKNPPPRQAFRCQLLADCIAADLSKYNSSTSSCPSFRFSSVD